MPAHASLWELLQKDLDAAEQSQAQDTAQDAALQTEALREGSKDLFPAFPVEVKGALEGRKEERVGEFVSATINGKTVVFHDTPIKEWFGPYVRTMAERGVVGGYNDASGNPLGEFRPAHAVSLEEMAKILVSLTGGVTDRCSKTSLNLSASGSWSSAFIACAESSRWVIFSDGTVDVKRQATRAEVMISVLQAYKKEPGQPMGGVFKDVPISLPFASAIEMAHADGIVIGYTDAQGNATGMFGPGASVTRAELVKILTLANETYGAKPK